MSTSINPKSAVDFTVKAPRKSLLKRTRWLALSVVLAFAHFPVAALAQSSSRPSIQVKVLNISNSVGTIGCALFESAEGFPLSTFVTQTTSS